MKFAEDFAAGQSTNSRVEVTYPLCILGTGLLETSHRREQNQFVENAERLYSYDSVCSREGNALVSTLSVNQPAELS